MAAPEMQVKVSADISELESALKTAEKATAAFVAGIGAVAAGIGAAVKSVVNMADEMTKASQKTGIAMKELQELAHVASLSGLSAKELQNGMARLTKGMADFARGGTSEAARGLQAVGVQVKNADGSMRSTSQVLGDLAEKFSGYRDGAEKSALALSIFGRAGMNMIPMLNSGSEAIADARKELEDFGAIASDQLGKDSERLNDNISRMGTFFVGIATQIAERVVPALASASEAIVTWMRDSGAAISIGNSLGAVFQNLEGIATIAAAALAVAFGPLLLSSIASITAAIAGGLTVALGGVIALLASNPFALAFAAIAAGAYVMGEDIIGTMKTVINTVIGSFRAAATDISFVWNNLGTMIGAAMVGIANSVIRVINDMITAAKSAINSLIGAINNIPGVKIDPLDTSSQAISELANEYAAAFGPALSERNRQIGEAMSADYIGSFVAGIKKLVPQAQAAVAGINKPSAPTVAAAGGGDGSEEDENQKLRERLERRLEVVRQSVLSEEELMIRKYQNAQALALQAFELDMQIYASNEEIKLQKAQEYHALREALEQKHLQNLDTLRARSNAASLNDLASFFSGAQALAQSNGKKAFGVAKAFAIAQAVLSTTSAAIQAMADPTAITPFQKFANYAMVLGKGLSAVASIRGMSASGGGGGGGGGGAASAGGAGSMASAANAAGGGGGQPGGNSVYINLQGQSFGRDQVRDLIKQIASYQKDGGQVVLA